MTTPNTAFTSVSRKKIISKKSVLARADTTTSQEDACAALELLLEAYERRFDDFDVRTPTNLENVLRYGRWPAYRPSKLHFVLETTTTYHLGPLSPNLDPEVIEVDADGQHRTYRCELVLRVDLPVRAVKRPREDREEDPVLSLTALIRRTFDVDYGEHGEKVPVKRKGRYYPVSRRRQDQTELVAVPDHFLIALSRFGDGPDAPKRAQLVDIPLVFEQHQLRGFIEHRGETMRSGHYVAYIEDGGLWYCINDTEVIPVPDITEYLGRAYVLYYE